MSGALWLGCPHCTYRFRFEFAGNPQHAVWIACCSRCGKTFPVSPDDRAKLADTPEAGNVRALPAYRPSGSNDPIKPPTPLAAGATTPKPDVRAVPPAVKTPPTIERFDLTDKQRAASARLLELALGPDWEWPS